MELYQLRAFVAVAAEGHLTRAAGKLHTSQPAVSAQIKALEEELQLSLFTRTSRGMLLTTSGQELLPFAEKMLNDSQLMANHARVLRNEVVGTLQLGLNEDGEFLRIEALCGALVQRYPRLQFNLQNSNSELIQMEVVRGILDCGYIFGACPHEELDLIELGRQRIVVVAPVAWQRRVEGASWQEIVTLPWIWQYENCPYRIEAERFFTAANIQIPESVYTADQDATTLAIISSGIGIGLIKEQDALQAQAQGKVFIWQGEHLNIDLRFVYRQDRRQDPRIQAVIDVVKSIWLPAAESQVATAVS